MASLRSPLYLIILFAYGVAISSSFLARVQDEGKQRENHRTKRREALVPSKRGKEKYCCSETGYQISFNCREVRGEEASHKKDAKETPQKDQSNVNNEGDEDIVDSSVK
ncbi:hypothetical protein Bca52824_060501 [Brassica carinata]|uniref:Uncharacterized protein n=1 Tax=Brassica carinata TaxID=52824 RepID=A0A8X7QXL3_BRACI|nr:hypothetical protein Bca52824_060501 [Brassica carinata]